MYQKIFKGNTINIKISENIRNIFQEYLASVSVSVNTLSVSVNTLLIFLLNRIGLVKSNRKLTVYYLVRTWVVNGLTF